MTPIFSCPIQAETEKECLFQTESRLIYENLRLIDKEAGTIFMKELSPATFIFNEGEKTEIRFPIDPNRVLRYIDSILAHPNKKFPADYPGEIKMIQAVVKRTFQKTLDQIGRNLSISKSDMEQIIRRIDQLKLGIKTVLVSSEKPPSPIEAFFDEFRG